MPGIFNRAIFNDAIFNTAAVASNVSAGVPRRDKRKKRWWQLDDRLYYATRKQIEQMAESFVAMKQGIEIPAPALKSKPAASPVIAALPRSFDLMRPRVEPRIDWTGFYDELAKRDFEAAQVLMQVLKRKREEEDDEEVILLAH